MRSSERTEGAPESGGELEREALGQGNAGDATAQRRSWSCSGEWKPLHRELDIEEHAGELLGRGKGDEQRIWARTIGTSRGSREGSGHCKELGTRHTAGRGSGHGENKGPGRKL